MMTYIVLEKGRRLTREEVGARRRMEKINKEIALEILDLMPEEKKRVLNKCLYRNLLLTSCKVLSWCNMNVYKEGYYLQFEGTRVKFSVFAKDNDGKLEVMKRKPNEDKLNKLYKCSLLFNESDFAKF